jgi:nickel/cobalt transporter (NiCoT) family protein
MAGAVGLLTVFGWGTLIATVLPHHYSLGTVGVFGLGTGANAYLLGVRHAFDADHVAAIDNVTRRLTARGRGHRAVGFWFSLGHATVVLVLCVLLSLGLRGIAGQLADADNGLAALLAVIGSLVGAGFLLLAGTLNVTSLPGLGRAWRAAKVG